MRAEALKAVTDDSSSNSSFLIRHGDAAEYRSGPAPLPGTVWINYNDHVLATPNINFVNPINPNRNTQLKPNRNEQVIRRDTVVTGGGLGPSIGAPYGEDSVNSDLLVHYMKPGLDEFRSRRKPVFTKKKFDPSKTTCMLYLQADHLFYNMMGSEEACIESMTRHVQRVNSIYQTTGKNVEGLGVSSRKRRMCCQMPC